jgi:ABC-type lipoprotein export system ATPase subunit
VLELEHVCRTYEVGEGQVHALNDVQLRIPDGDYLAIVGPSGSGKSTLLQIIGLLDRPTDGRVLLDAHDVGQLSDADRTNLRLHTLGFIFQRFHLIPELTALENVALPMEAAGASVAERYGRAVELLARVGLGDRLNFRPSQLSGGQRQRVAIARALANQPRLILADEPTGELHTADKTSILDLFRRFNRDGHTVIVVTHDPEVAAIASHHVEMRDGHLKEIQP